MKKIASAFLAIAAAAAPVAINAQEASSKFVLTDIEDQEWGESVVFTYNNQGKVVSYTNESDITVRSDLTYDEQGRCIRDMYNQDLDRIGNQFVQTSYVDYTYDEQGRLATRTNYSNTAENLSIPKWDLQAICYYTYDADGKLLKEEYFRDDTKTIRVIFKEYQYNEAGQLVTLNDTYYKPGTGEEVSKGRVTYAYNDNGTISEKCSMELDNNGQFFPRAYTIYVYADNGVIEEIFTTGGSKNIENKLHSFLYTVDETIPAADVVYPTSIPEPLYNSELMPAQPYMIMGVEEYVLGQDDAPLIRDHNWQYNYDDEILGISNATAVVGSNLVAAQVNGDVLKLVGLNMAENVTIVDLNGRVVKRFATTGSSINVADLAKGVYVVTTSAGTAKFVR